jgi:hypothetical protein
MLNRRRVRPSEDSTSGLVAVAKRRGHARRLPRCRRISAIASTIVIAGFGSSCGQSSPHVASSNESAAESISPACALMTETQASSILGGPIVAVPTKPDHNDDSSCLWHSSESNTARPSFSIFLYHNANAVRSFNSNLSRPQPSVQRISFDGLSALWRPYSGTGPGAAFISTATHGSLLSVEAVGGTTATNSVAKGALSTALHTLRSRGQ